MKHLAIHLRSLAVAVTALALSAGLAIGAELPAASSWGLANAAAHAGKTVPVAGGTTLTSDEESAVDEQVDEMEDTEGDTEDVDAAEDAAGTNCATDPTTLTDEELAAMRHGSVVCWAAQQTEWPDEFENHGAWVSSWAKKNHGSGAATDAGANGQGHGKGNGRGNAPSDN